MEPAAIFPDATLLLVGHLRRRLPAIQVGTRIPNPRPPVFCAVRRIGGTRLNTVFDQARMDCQLWATSDEALSTLASEVRAAILDSPAHVPGIRAVQEETGITNIPDPDSLSPRSIYSVTLVIRGTLT